MPTVAQLNVDVDADIGGFVRNMGEVQAILRAFERYKVGDVRIGADISDLADGILEAQALIRSVDGYNANIDIVARGAAEAVAEVAATEAALNRIDGETVTADIDVDGVEEAAAQVQLVMTTLFALDRERVRPVVDLETEALQARLRAVDRQLAEMDAQRVTVTLDLDGAAIVERQVQMVESLMAGLDATDARPEVDLDGIQLAATQIRLVDSLLAGLDGREVQPHIDLDAAGAVARLAVIEAELAAMDAETVTIDIDVDGAAESIAQLNAVTAAGALAGKNIRKKVDTDTTGALAGLNALSFAATRAGSSIGGIATAVLLLGPALIPIAAAATQGFMGLLGSITAAGVGLGLFGVTALSIYKPVTDGVNKIRAAELELTRAITDDERETALENLQQAWQQLTPAQAEAAQTLIDFRDAWTEFAHQFEPQVFTLVNTALTGLMGLFPEFGAIIGPVADVLQDLTERLFSSLGDPLWQSFFAWLAAEAAPAIDFLATSIGNLITGLMGMLVAFTPAQHAFEAGFLAMTERFVAWSNSLDSNPGFQHFMDYMRQATPEVMALLRSIWDAFTSLFSALEPLGLVVVDALTQVFDAIAHLADTRPQLLSMTILVAGLAAGLVLLAAPILAIANLAVGLVKAFGSISAVMHLVGSQGALLIGVLALLTAAFVYGWNNVVGFRDAFDQMATVLGAAWAALQPVFDALILVIQALIPALAQIILALMPLGEAFGNIVIALAPLAENVALLAASLISVLGPALAGIIGPIANFLAAITSIPGLVQAAAAGFVLYMLPALATMAAGWATTAAAAVAGAATTAAAWISLRVEALATMLAQAPAFVATILGFESMAAAAAASATTMGLALLSVLGPIAIVAAAALALDGILPKGVTDWIDDVNASMLRGTPWEKVPDEAQSDMDSLDSILGDGAAEAIQSFKEEFAAGVPGAVGVIGDAGTQTANAFATGLDRGAVGYSDRSRQWVEDLRYGIADGSPPLLEEAAGIPQAVLDAMPPPGGEFSREGQVWLAELVQAVQSGQTDLSSIMAEMPKTLAADMGDAKSMFTPKGLEMLEGLTTGFGQGQAGVDAFFLDYNQKVAALIGDNIPMVSAGGRLMSGLEEGMGNRFETSTLPSMVAMAHQAARAARGDGTPFKNTGHSWMDDAKTGADEGATALKGDLGTLPADVAAAMADLTAFKQVGTDMITQMNAGIEESVSDVSIAMGVIRSQILTSLSDAATIEVPFGMGLVAAAFTTQWAYIGMSATTAMSGVTTAIGLGLATASIVVGTSMMIIAASFGAGMTAVTTVVTTAMTTTTAVVVAAMAVQVAIVGASMAAMTAAVQAAETAMLAVTVLAMAGMYGVTLAMMVAISATVAAWMARIVSIVASAAAAMVNAIRAQQGNAAGAAGGMAAAAAAAVAWLPGYMYGSGRSAGANFAAGLRSEIGNVAAAAGALAGAAAGPMPGSPADWGPLSGQGYTYLRGQRFAEDLAAGMASQTALVASAALGMAQAMSSVGGGRGSLSGGLLRTPRTSGFSAVGGHRGGDINLGGVKITVAVGPGQSAAEARTAFDGAAENMASQIARAIRRRS